MIEDSTQKHAVFTEANTSIATDSLVSLAVHSSYFTRLCPTRVFM